MVFLLLNCIAAETNSDLLLHLETFAETLTYDRAYNRNKYMG